MTTLSERDRAMLALERRPWRHGAVKADAIRDTLDMSETRPSERARQGSPRALEAWEHDAVTVGRLRRLRDARSERRSSRRG